MDMEWEYIKNVILKIKQWLKIDMEILFGLELE
jgi:hypothetical protein